MASRNLKQSKGHFVSMLMRAMSVWAVENNRLKVCTEFDHAAETTR